MNRDEERQSLLDDLNMAEMDLDYVYDQIRLGRADEEEEDSYINELQNQIMYIEACLRDYDE